MLDGTCWRRWSCYNHGQDGVGTRLSSHWYCNCSQESFALYTNSVIWTGFKLWCVDIRDCTFVTTSPLGNEESPNLRSCHRIEAPLGLMLKQEWRSRKCRICTWPKLEETRHRLCRSLPHALAHDVTSKWSSTAARWKPDIYRHVEEHGEASRLQ